MADIKKYNCLWEQISMWKGIDPETGGMITGPKAECKIKNCGVEENFTWEEWNSLPEAAKIEPKPRRYQP